MRPLTAPTPPKHVRGELQRQTRTRPLRLLPGHPASGSPITWLLSAADRVWADRMRKEWPIAPRCDEHGVRKVRLATRGWRCRPCHARRTQEYRDRRSPEQAERARSVAREQQRARRADPSVRAANRDYQRRKRAAERTTQ